MERPKLELNLNEAKTIRLLFDEAIIGESHYGPYFLYAVSNGSDKEYSFFAPEEVHSVLKKCEKGTTATITKIASQKGSKLVTSYNVEVDSVDSSESDSGNSVMHSQTNPYLDMMIQSFEDALVIQQKYKGMANVNQISITMFIQRAKGKDFQN